MSENLDVAFLNVLSIHVCAVDDWMAMVHVSVSGWPIFQRDTASKKWRRSIQAGT